METKDEFPMLVYRSNDGRTHDCAHAKTPADLDKLLKAGWLRSVPEAIEAHEAKAKAAPPAVVAPKGK